MTLTLYIYNRSLEKIKIVIHYNDEPHTFFHGETEEKGTITVIYKVVYHYNNMQRDIKQLLNKHYPKVLDYIYDRVNGKVEQGEIIIL